MTELNTLYYNSASGNCYTGSGNILKSCYFTNTGLNQEARDLTADALYYLGGSPADSELYADDFYNIERGTTVWGSTSDQTCNDGACPRATTWVGRVGIIYPSDLLYARDLSTCTAPGYVGGGMNSDNCNNNWLAYNGTDQWTISPTSDIAFYAFPGRSYSVIAGSGGGVYNAYAVPLFNI